MTITKFLLSTIITIAVPLATFASDGTPDDYNSNRTWSGTFKIADGPIFQRLLATVLFIYDGKSAAHVINHPKLIISKESGIDDWKPLCDLTLTTEMTAQEFFRALSLAANIKEIQPPELAKFLTAAESSKAIGRTKDRRDGKKALITAMPSSVKVAEGVSIVKAAFLETARTMKKDCKEMTNAEIAAHLGLNEEEVAALS